MSPIGYPVALPKICAACGYRLDDFVPTTIPIRSEPYCQICHCQIGDRWIAQHNSWKLLLNKQE